VVRMWFSPPGSKCRACQSGHVSGAGPPRGEGL
jgi:hypothetical protein